MFSSASFFGFLSFAFFFFAILTPATANFQLPDLPNIFSQVSFPKLSLHAQVHNFEFDLEAALPPASSTSAPLAPVPKACAAYEGPANECAAGMAATSVTYEDCGSTFSVCRCADANMTMDTVVDRLGRVPVGLRRFIGTVMVLGGETQAYTNLTNGEIHFFGNCKMDTWVHEAAHAFDYAIPRTPYSNSAGWENATLQDTCAPDEYSLTNQVEDFAKMTVIKVYMLLHDGNLPPDGFKSACMQNQLDFIGALPLFNATRLFGNTCSINDGMRGARRNIGPSVLNATRTFQTVPLEALPVRTAEAAVKNSGLSRRFDIPIGQYISVFVIIWLL